MDTTDLTASTGAGDDSSVFGSGLLSTLDTLGKVGQTGAGLYTSLPGKAAPAGTAAAPAAAASTSTWTKYLPWIIGGVVLLVVLGFVFRR